MLLHRQADQTDWGTAGLVLGMEDKVRTGSKSKQTVNGKSAQGQGRQEREQTGSATGDQSGNERWKVLHGREDNLVTR